MTAKALHNFDTAARIAVLGGSGRTGHHILERIAALGGRPAVLVRDRSKLHVKVGVDVVIGDARDGQAVSAALRGAHAVIDATGPSADADEHFGAAVAANVLDCMQVERVRRLVTITGAMVGGGELPLMYKLILAMMKKRDRAVLEGRRKGEALIMASKLEWTILRPPRLTDGPATGKVEAGPDLPLSGGASISRADLAHYAVTCATSPRHARQAVRVKTAG